MKNSPVQSWFQELQRLWLEKDIKALKNILAEECQYYEDPFLPPCSSWKEIESVWQEIHEQMIKKLEILVLIDKVREGSGSYSLMYEDALGVLHESKGSYYVKLNEVGKAVEFRQWWVVK